MTRSYQYSRWVDPAPLEVERLRLPWWTMLPRKLLLAASPIIVVVAAVTVLVAVASGCGLWAWGHRESFARTVGRQVRSEWRRTLIYAWPWKRVMLFSDLTKRTGRDHRSTHHPKHRRVRADGWRDRVSVKLLHGQCADTFASHAAELANSFGAQACRVRVDRPRRIWLDFLHTDPLAQPIGIPALADPGAVVDLAHVVIGRTETGRPWLLRLADRHILVADVSDAGKSSVMWAALHALAPGIRSSLVQVFGIDGPR